ncbi:MAG TPA: metallophosphoesterase [Gemmatimonadales bacterium]|nr:metallophosphoesterase [Gemmatimonadales bacterium]
MTIDPVELIGAGDIASCHLSYQDEATASLIQLSPQALVFTAGDNAYPDGTADDYACFHASWGVFKDRIRPTPGNHEYRVRVTGQPADANPYFDYFNGVGADSGVAGKRGLGYYAYDYGGWRIYAINSEVSTTSTSAQLTWLRADLAANPRVCVMAIWHKPFFTSGVNHAGQTSMKPVWEALDAAGGDVVISGHNHQYERFAPQTAAGVASASGIREFVVGTGGSSNHYGFATTPAPNSEVRGSGTGVIRFRLLPESYQWEFLPIEGDTLTDSGSADCSPVPPPAPPSPIGLTLSGRTAAGTNYMALDWTGATGASVVVYRNDALLTTTPNDGHYVNSAAAKSAVTYTYRVCEAAGGVCSPSQTVEFGGSAPPSPPPPPPIALRVSGRIDATTQYMVLDWTGASGASVDVYRNGSRITTTPNDGHYTNSRRFQGAATYVYKVCEAGRISCSNEQSVSFP